ncbi:MAG: hypothetical protein U0354_21065 [Candidatus Sericytochromatia bacterium]
MEKDTEITVKKQGQFTKDDPRINREGRPKGSLDFKTKFEIFLEKLAKQNNLTPQEIDEQLFATAYKKAKDGDYQFWRDVHDRIYGKPLQKQETDITSGGEKLASIIQIVKPNDNYSI